MKKPEIGDVLIQNTCDAIEFGLDGKYKRINEHDEHWLVEDIKKGKYKLYNLDKQRTLILSELDIIRYIALNNFIPTDIKA